MQTGFQGVGITGGNIGYIATAPPPPQYYNRGRGQGKGRGRGRGRGRGSRGKSNYRSQQPCAPTQVAIMLLLQMIHGYATNVAPQIIYTETAHM